MEKIKQFIQTFLVDEQGATAIEYGLIASLISLAIIVPAGLIGVDLLAIFGRIATALV